MDIRLKILNTLAKNAEEERREMNNTDEVGILQQDRQNYTLAQLSLPTSTTLFGG
jgi:hypothetical protein